MKRNSRTKTASPAPVRARTTAIMSAVPGAAGGSTDRADGRSCIRGTPASGRDTRLAPLGVALAAIILVATVAITWFRVPGSHRDRVWAEDANIFLAQAISEGPWRVLFEGYAGYQHLVPRIVVAGIYPFFDLGDYPRIVYAICAVITGAVAVAVFALSRDLVPFLPSRVALGLITALIPLATQETVGNLADLHTYAMWLAPWLLLYRPRTWPSSVGWAVVAFLTVMTEIQAVFFVFLIAFGLRRASRRAWPIFASFLVDPSSRARPPSSWRERRDRGRSVFLRPFLAGSSIRSCRSSRRTQRP